VPLPRDADPILLVLQVALGAAIFEVGRSDMWKQIALAGSAGALGAALSGIFRVRDRLVELDDLRSSGLLCRSSH